MKPALDNTFASPGPLIRIGPQTYPVLDRWMSMTSGEFRDSLDQLAALAADSDQPPPVQKSIRVAVEALAGLYRRRLEVISPPNPSNNHQRR